jgi:predicted extracellular nuclease
MRKYFKISVLVLPILFFSCGLHKNEKDVNKNVSKRGDFRIMFYNTENFFDVKHDSLKNDQEFMPEGAKRWTYYKLQDKIFNIAKVITAVGQWESPEIVGLCEIENQYVLEQLVNYSPIKSDNYHIIHKESPDRRGIDVALLYRQEKFKPIFFNFIEIKMPKPFTSTKTRDLLYVKGIAENKDTIHVFVNHWPSRWGGQQKSEPKRIFVASVLKKQTDSILNVNPKSRIIIMGDFNDGPDNISLKDILNAKRELGNIITDTTLINLTAILHNKTGQGTHKYHGEWAVLDQFIVSGYLLNNKSTFSKLEDVHIFNNKMLLEKDEKYTGQQPNRTYIGYKYHRGFSDHLPIYLDLNISK